MWSQEEAHLMGRSKLAFFLFLLVALGLLSVHDSSAAKVRPTPLGEGSLPARLFPDGSVCLVDANNPSVCGKRLVRIPRRVMKAHSVTFYGVFDLDGDGSPEVFVDHWSPFNRQDGDNVVLLVYKKIHGKYRQYLRLKAESYGYDPGAWFLDEPPHPKAVFMARYGGSSGSGLFHLNLEKKSLDLISGPVFLEGHPQFLDLDSDGMAEIFLPGRGRDRTSQPGAAILHWQDKRYEMWWPAWTGPPAVIYAALTDVDGDGKKEIVAVLEPLQIDFDKFVDGKTPCPRELATWKAVKEGPALISKTKLPDARYLAEPHFDRFPPFSSSVELTYSRTVECTMRNTEMECREEE
jgi:hypothetical protein